VESVAWAATIILIDYKNSRLLKSGVDPRMTGPGGRTPTPSTKVNFSWLRLGYGGGLSLKS